MIFKEIQGNQKLSTSPGDQDNKIKDWAKKRQKL